MTPIIQTIHESLPEEKRAGFVELWKMIQELVKEIESSPELTKNRYDRYLPFTNNKVGVVMLIQAQGNLQGIMAAAKINGTC